MGEIDDVARGVLLGECERVNVGIAVSVVVMTLDVEDDLVSVCEFVIVCVGMAVNVEEQLQDSVLKGEDVGELVCVTNKLCVGVNVYIGVRKGETVVVVDLVIEFAMVHVCDSEGLLFDAEKVEALVSEIVCETSFVHECVGDGESDDVSMFERVEVRVEDCVKGEV